MNTPRNLTAIAVLGISLAFGPGQANAAAGQSTAYGNWQVTEMRAGAEMDLPYCAMSNYFSNDVLLVMSKNADGTGSVALDFNSNRLSLDKRYPVTIDIANRAQYAFDAYPGNRQALVVELDNADELFMPMAKYPEITMSVANTKMAFDLGPFITGMNDLNGCLSALTGQQIAAVDVSKITVGDEPAGTPAPASTPMGGVAQAMWKSDAAPASAQKQPQPMTVTDTAELPGVKTQSAPAQPKTTVVATTQTTANQPVQGPGGLQLMSSNAAAQGIDLSKIYATGPAPAMQQAAAQPVPLQQQQQVAQQPVPDVEVTQAMPAAGDEGMKDEAPAPQGTAVRHKAAPGQVKESMVFSTNRQKDAPPPSVMITADQQKPMAPSMDGQPSQDAQQVNANYDAMRAKQTGQAMQAPTSVADLGDNTQASAVPHGSAQGSGPLKTGQAMDPSIYRKMREKYSTPVYDRRGVNVPLAQAVEQISPPGYAVKVLEGVNAQTVVSWNGGRPWRVLLDELLEPHGYSAIVTENKITLAAKKK